MSAVLSDCGTYRYALWREWLVGEGTMLFVMLNPSTADASADDPTIRRCIGFAQREGCKRLAVGNLYAFRSPSPARLYSAQGPVGEFDGRENLNDRWLRQLATDADRIVVAWGANAGPIEWRPERVLELLVESSPKQPQALGFTDDGSPRHPLYVKADAELVPVELGDRETSGVGWPE